MAADNEQQETTHDGTCATGPIPERVVEPGSWFRRTVTGSLVRQLLDADGRTVDDLSANEIHDLAQDYASRIPEHQLREALYRMTVDHIYGKLSPESLDRLKAEIDAWYQAAEARWRAENPGQS